MEELKKIELNIELKSKPRMTKRDRFLSSVNFYSKNEKLMKRHKKLREYWDCKTELIHLFKENNIEYNNWDSLNNIDFVIQMPKSWTKKKKKLLLNQKHQQKPDLNNLVKALEDFLFEDDAKISSYNNVNKIWGETHKLILYVK